MSEHDLNQISGGFWKKNLSIDCCLQLLLQMLRLLDLTLLARTVTTGGPAMLEDLSRQRMPCRVVKVS